MKKRIRSNIIPECYLDTSFAKVMGYEEPNHQQGIENVNREMKENFADSLAIGLVDMDLNQGPEIKLLENVDNGNENGLVLKRRKNSRHYFIFHKGFEKWILECAELGNVNPAEYQLPNNFRELKKITKNERIGRDLRIWRFLKAIKKADPPPVQTVRKWIDKLSNE